MPAALIAALLLTPPGTPSGGFHWQRIITPPPGAATEQACVVLDAATFSNAAPALRDLRLFQDGTELPYVIEESYDERALNSGVTPDDDRSEYEPVYIGVLRPRLMPRLAGQNGPAGQGAAAVSPTASIQAFVDAHVPVERVRLDPAPADPMRLEVTATPSGAAASSRESDAHTFVLTQPAWAFTLGANLQHGAVVTITGASPGAHAERVFLEMRRRSLCYQPRSASPLVLYLGGGQGISAKTYGLSNGFSVSANRPYATMGPLEPNPDLQPGRQHPVSRLLIAIGVLGATLLLTLWIGLELLRKEKGRPKATHPV